MKGTAYEMDHAKINYMREFAVTQMNHWALFPVYLFLTGFFKSFTVCDEPVAAVWLAAGLLPILFYVCRVGVARICAHRKLFFLQPVFLLASHLGVVLAFAGLMPHETEAVRFLHMLTGTCYGIYSVFLRLRQEDFQDGEIFMPVAAGLSAGACFLTGSMGHGAWENYYLFALIGVFGLYFISTYLKRFLGFVAVNESSAGHIPEREIFLSGGRLVLAFTAFAVAVLFLFSGMEWLYAILKAIKELLLEVLRFLFSLLPEPAPGTVAPEAVNPITEDRNVFWAAEESTQPFFLWRILEAAMLLAILAFIMAGACRLLCQLIVFIKSRMAYMPGAEDKAQGGIVDIREKCDIRKKKPGLDGREPWKIFSPRERIRRLYRRHILNAQSQGSALTGSCTIKNPALLTAREWGMLLGESGMPAVYEKARYSQEACTETDVRRMREYCK